MENYDSKAEETEYINDHIYKIQELIEKDMQYPTMTLYNKQIYNELAMRKDRIPYSWTPIKYL